MNPLVLLMGLLVLSYIGSFLVGGRAIRGFGLPSGSEYLALGFAIGPAALGIVDRSMLAAFEPIAIVALGWLAFVLGLEYAFSGRRRVRVKSFLAACFIAVLTGSAVAMAEYCVLPKVTGLSGTELILMAGGIGAASSETTRHAVRWVTERHRAKGNLSELLGELADSDDLLPILATAVLFAFAPTGHMRFALPNLAWAGITIGLGVLVGAVATALLGREFRIQESWGVLFGTSLFAIGIAARLNLSFLALMFFMGLTLAALSHHRDEVVAMVAPTERPVLLPALLLAGARIDPHASPALGWIVAAALFARVAGKFVAGFFLRAAFPAARRGGSSLGLGLLSTGALAMAIGLSFALRYPGPLGDSVLATVAVITVFGEFVGPNRLRATLDRAGELAGPVSSSPPPAQSSPPPGLPPPAGSPESLARQKTAESAVSS